MTQLPKERNPARSSRVESLQAEYAILEPLAVRFANDLAHQIEQLIVSHEITLSIPLKHRIKRWPSIREKLERTTLNLIKPEKPR